MKILFGSVTSLRFDERNHVGFTAGAVGLLLVLAYAYGSAETQAKSSDLSTPVTEVEFSHAIEDGQVEHVKTLLKSGADVNAKGNSPICIAVIHQRLEILSLLLDDGANPNSIDKRGCSALYWAANTKQSDAVALLLSKGAKVEPGSGPYPLIEAAALGDDRAIQLLLAKGADVTVNDERGNTALHRAVQNGHVEVVRILIAHGAVAAKNHFGKTPLNYAEISRNEQIIALLKGVERN